MDNNFFRDENFIRTESVPKKVKGKIIAGVSIMALIIGLFIAAGIYLDIIQLKEIRANLSSVYITNIQYKLIFSGVVFIIVFAVFSITNMFIKKALTSFLKQNGDSMGKFPNYIISSVVALLTVMVNIEVFYRKALTYLNAVGFGSKDPLFGKDIGYYVFERPFLMSIYDFISTLWLFVIIYTICYYVIYIATIYKNISWKDILYKKILRHNIINIALFFLIKAFSYKFEKESLLFGSFAGIKGAGYVDNTVWKLYYSVAPFILGIIVILTFLFVWKGKHKKAAYSIAFFPAIFIVVSIVASITQFAFVRTDELTYEKKYIKMNIEKTREAFKLNKMESFPFAKVEPLNKSIIDNNKDTIENIRVVDYKATLESNKQLQSLTNFYSFNDGDIINYNINGKETPVFISAREINKDALPSKTYTNTMFKYTHGYGIVMNPINRFTNAGQTDFILSGLQSNVNKDLKINEPRIYYGELTKDYVVVNPASANKLKETDYDGKNTETSYDTKNCGGIRLNTINRLLFAIKQKDYNFIFSGNITSQSKMLLNRQIIERAKRAVPFLTVDNDAYIILTDDGTLKWVLDAYTSTNFYPFSESFSGVNYIRNSVKIIVDSYTGSVDYYIIDNEDPIIKVYDKIYPDVFNKGDLPEYVKKHMRYPESLFKLQTEVLKGYHIIPDSDQSITSFYGNQDLWEIATTPGRMQDEEILMEPYYNMIRLPGKFGSKEELILMRPFTPSGERHNLGSWMSVRNSFDDYGKLILFSFPKDNDNIFGPYQVEVKINQIDSISKDMTLWGQGGSEVFKGNLLVIPIENSILYVEPIYIRSSPKAIPEVRKIVVGYQDGNEFRYGKGNNLDNAIKDLFNDASEKVDVTTEDIENTDTGATKEELIDEIITKYDTLKQQLDDLDKLLKELKEK